MWQRKTKLQLFSKILQMNFLYRKLPYTINYVYYWTSLTFLILKTAAVFLCAAEVNEQAVKPLELLRRLPNSMWNVDVERLADQIRCETIALSGMRFYYMTRRLLFGVNVLFLFKSKYFTKIFFSDDGNDYHIRNCANAIWTTKS